MDIRMKSTTYKLPNELFYEISKFVKFEDLKNLRLVNRIWYENATRVIRKKHYPCVQILPNDLPEDQQSIENFICVMGSSNMKPFDNIILTISTWSYNENTIVNFLQQFGDKVMQCMFNCYGTEVHGIELLTKMKIILCKAVNLKKLIFVNMANLSDNKNFKIELSPTVQNISIWGQHSSRDSCVGNETLSILSYMKMKSLPIFELNYNCSTCLANMLQQLVGRGFKSILRSNCFYTRSSEVNQLKTISEIKNPTLKISKMVVFVNTQDRNPLFWKAIYSIFAANENNLEQLEVCADTNSTVPADFKIQKLPNLRQLTLANSNTKLTANHFQNLRFLRLNFQQESEVCPIQIVGNFLKLSKLEIDSSMLSFLSSQTWIPSFSSVYNLKIVISRPAEKTTLLESFQISKQFKNVVDIKIAFQNLDLYYDQNVRNYDEGKDFKQWTGADMITSNKFKKYKNKSKFGLCDLPKLTRIKVTGLCRRTYMVWINILVYLTCTKQLKPLTSIVLKPNFLCEAPKIKFSSSKKTNMLVPYHHSVELIDW